MRVAVLAFAMSAAVPACGTMTTSSPPGTSDGGANPPECPSSEPAFDAPCTGSIACVYTPSCPTHSQCSNGRWKTTQAPCSSREDTCTPAGGECACSCAGGGKVKASMFQCPLPFGDGCDMVCCIPGSDASISTDAGADAPTDG